MAEKIEIIAELKDLVKGHLKEITAEVNRLDSAIQNVGKGSSGGIGGGGIMSQVLGANLLTGAVERTVGAIVDYGKESLDAYGKQEQFLTSLKTLFHGNALEAESLNGKLIELAKTTPFELTEVQDATKMMVAYGSTSGGVVDELKMLGDLSSGVGSSLNEIAYLYGTLRTQGRAYTMDIRQFAGRGIPIIKELAKQFKVADSQIMKMVEDGKIGFNEVEKAFKSMTSSGGQFFNMMNEQAKTQVGLVSNLSDAWNQLKVGNGEQMSDTFKGLVGWLTEAVNKSGDLVKNFNSMNRVLDKANLGLGYFEKMSGTAGDYTGLEKYLNEVVAFSGKGEKESALAKNSLNAYLKKSAEDYKAESELSDVSGEPGPDALKFLRETALLRKSLDKIAEGDRSRKIEEKNKEAKSPSKLETLAKANRPTQIIVNIENLVRELSNVYQNTTRGMELTAEQVGRILTGAVNDFSVLEHG